MQPRPPCEEKRRCGAPLLRLRRALLLRAAAKDIKLGLWRSVGSLWLALCAAFKIKLVPRTLGLVGRASSLRALP